MKIFDSHEGAVVDFKPLEENKVSFYVCGPTVYDIPHLGHGRSAVVFDVIRKFLMFDGYEVKFVSNYTDIDDKMIKRASEENITVEELTNKIIPEYEKDYGSLNVLKPDAQPKATEYIDEILDLIEKLEQGSHIYTIDGDGVYFDVSTFAKYGALSKQRLEDLQMGARIEVKDEKRNPYDFALWKFKKEGEPFWPSKWGDGRPGWHIECSAMSWGNLGESFDIHGGGLDLKFPHHECEIAQSHGALGEGTFAKYWIHNGFITIDKEKMSKSLNNFFTLRDIFKQYDPLVVRFFFLQTHYRSPIDFSDKLLDQAAAGLERVHDFVRNIKNSSPDPGEATLSSAHYVSKFKNEMRSDFNVPGALSVLFDYIKDINKIRDGGTFNEGEKREALNFLEKIDQVLAVILTEEELTLTDEQVSLVRQREEARNNKDWAKSDEIRDLLLRDGIVLEDTSEGTIWKRS